MAREHALHVAVEDRRAFAEREGRDRRGRGPADAGQRGNGGGIARKAATVLRDDHACRRMQVMRATVVAEAAPELEHAIDGSRGERADLRVCREKPLVVRNDGRHLRLLQHDLGEPDAIGIARALPREVVAAVRLLPRNQA